LIWFICAYFLQIFHCSGYYNGGKFVTFFFLENKYLFLYLFSIYTWYFYHFTIALFITLFFLIFIFCNIFLVFPLFFVKNIIFILYTLNIYHFTLSYFIQFFLFLSLFFCNLFFFLYTFCFSKNPYTKIKEIMFQCSNCNIVLFITMLKISLKSYMFLLTYMIFTIFHYM